MRDFGPAALLMILDIHPGSEGEVSAWHAEEHITERMEVPGFQRGRRCVEIGEPSTPRFLVIYEADDPSVFESSTYLERLNDPTPWSRTIAENHIASLQRTICIVTASKITGIGAWHGVIAMNDAPSEEGAQQIEQAIAQRGVTGAHLLAGTEIGQQLTAEKAARGGADQTLAGALIFEGTDESAVRKVTERCAARLSSEFSPIFLLQHLVT